MAYFPFFMEIGGRRCVIVGGGHVALRKAEKLLSFSPEITVIAPQICEALAALPVICLRREFRQSDLDGAFMVIAATNDRLLNHRIYTLCEAQKIPVNTVDDVENCSFIFPALVHEPPVSVGISTGGASPVFAKYLRMLIEEELTEKAIGTANILCRFRPIVREMFSKEKLRREALEAVLDLCQTGDTLPSDDEVQELLERIYENQNRNAAE